MTVKKLLNMKYSVCSNIDISSKKFEQKTLVIHTAVTPFLWNPILDKNDKISGVVDLKVPYLGVLGG